MASFARGEPDLATRFGRVSLSNSSRPQSEGEEGPPLRVISTLDEAIEDELRTAFGGATTLALDAEGVDLGRHGRLSIVQLSTPEACFLFDVLGKGPIHPLVAWLRGPLEDEGVVKIIHDCQMDSDALHHLLGINLANVHDTSCWMATLSGKTHKGLNDTLEYFGVPSNSARGGVSVYKTNHAYWATRPLTEQMIQRAAGDVQGMFELQTRQLERLEAEGDRAEALKLRAEKKSSTFLTWARGAETEHVEVQNVGRFIGKRGATIIDLKRRTNTLIYERGTRGRGNFLVYYDNASSLRTVQRSATGGQGGGYGGRGSSGSRSYGSRSYGSGSYGGGNSGGCGRYYDSDDSNDGGFE